MVVAKNYLHPCSYSPRHTLSSQSRSNRTQFEMRRALSIPKNTFHRECFLRTERSFSIINSFASQQNPLCSLWPFSASSGFTSETLNTEVTESHREPQSNKATTRSLRRANISTRSCTNMILYAFGIRKLTAPAEPLQLLIGKKGLARCFEIR
jgi:hypothetical protein